MTKIGLLIMGQNDVGMFYMEQPNYYDGCLHEVYAKSFLEHIRAFPTFMRLNYSYIPLLPLNALFFLVWNIICAIYDLLAVLVFIFGDEVLLFLKA